MRLRSRLQNPGFTKFHYVFALLLCCLVGCGYSQPTLTEPYAIVHPIGHLRITAIDDSTTLDISGKYIFRVSPGSHVLTMVYGHSDTPVEGSDSSYAKFPIKAAEGVCYYVEAKIKRGFHNFLFGLGLRTAVAWRPVIQSQKPIQGYGTQKTMERQTQ